MMGEFFFFFLLIFIFYVLLLVDGKLKLLLRTEL